ncbi:hypothetical protein MKZ38_005538 [Zalerion maritima]|uniref:Uncharacterized protein n=1 Tax=Zalerion maritima TaxID=339359 RepID=A0AAD5RW72_9PEZI|nr:hypothetical protein MKZ38_005538 [Zalerion maritima]
MSSPAQAGPSTAPKEKKGLGKVLSRMKTVLKRDKGKGVAGPSTSTPAATTTAAAGPSTAKTVEPAKPSGPEPTKIPKTQIHEERARKLGAKFGLEIQPNEWHSTEGHALRVEKPIRMRIHRTCHECKTTFGTSKECPKCKHARCGKCTRYPPRRTEAEKQTSRERKTALVKKNKEDAPIVPDYDYLTSSKKLVLTRPSKKGGQDLVHKKPRQRVRRTCHECSTLFTAGTKTCTKCGHVRCTECPRDPSKKNKYPLGYPGDEFGPNAVPQFGCHECQTLFPPSTEDGTECSKCKHPKCGQCARAKPRKIDPEPDPEVLKSIQAKIEKLGIS